MYVCQECGYESTRWVGRCSGCNAWNTLVEVIERPTSARQPSGITPNAPVLLAGVSVGEYERLKTGIGELDRVLGGGIVPGSVSLVGGDPGIGKSTLLLQASAAVATGASPVLYISGEESVQQLRMRADRLNIPLDGLLVLNESDVDEVMKHIEKLNPRLVVVDSIQTCYLPGLSSSAGSITQVRECAISLLQMAKRTGIPLFLVGHVTKDGTIAGPRVLEHVVDAVLYLEGERFHAYRLLRGAKNRFGSTNEVGVFEMHGEGMVEVTNPSAVFLSERRADASGSMVTVVMEGTRSLLVEVQALTLTTAYGLPRRTANGIDFPRLLLMAAVLGKRAGLPLGNQDIYVNVVGGIKVTEPGADLGIALAIASSFGDQPISPEMVAVGEVGLSGEIRRVSHLERRLAEAEKLGFRKALVPGSARLEVRQGQLQAIPVATLKDAVRLVAS
jgi:DNA repair protein RadA/Sms